MAASAPFWEIIHKTEDVADGQPWFAHLKGRNGRIVATTETYRQRASVLKAIAVVDPQSLFEIREQ